VLTSSGTAVAIAASAGTSLRYANGVLRVTDSAAGRTATLLLNGSYSASNFALAHDGHGGTNILRV
jgi:hypothetical protein